MTTAAAGQTATVQQLRQDIQHELTTANQLARLISNELQIIKNFTNPGGEFEANVQKNASIISTLANVYHIDMDKIPPLVRKSTQNTHEEHNTRNESDMDDMQ